MFKVKLAHELKTGDKILLSKIEINPVNSNRYFHYSDIIAVGYVQCCGMSHFKYGEYGYLHLNDNKTSIITFKNAPFIVEE